MIKPAAGMLRMSRFSLTKATPETAARATANTKPVKGEERMLENIYQQKEPKKKPAPDRITESMPYKILRSPLVSPNVMAPATAIKRNRVALLKRSCINRATAPKKKYTHSSVITLQATGLTRFWPSSKKMSTKKKYLNAA